ncbi:ATP-grasp domain-containing protein [Nannocystaceae bacterium ST9]
MTIDLACAESGEWIVMEIGDGQVSGLPRATDAEALYSALVARAS